MASEPGGAKPGLAAGLGKHILLDLTSEETVEAGAVLERMEFDIVADAQADFKLGFLGAGTPLARALQGHRAGQVIPYPIGGAKEIHLLAVTASDKGPAEDIAARRQERLRKAVDQSDRTNAMIFASSFSGKWGDYDPTGFTDEGNDDDDEEVNG